MPLHPLLGVCERGQLRHVGLRCLTKDGAYISWFGRKILNSWTTREVPCFIFGSSLLIFYHLLARRKFTLLKYLHYSPSYPVLSMVPIFSCIPFNDLILFSFTISRPPTPHPIICQGYYLVTMSGSNLMLSECSMNVSD